MRYGKLTGRLRHRAQRRWGKEELVLQVEETGLETSWLGGFADSNWIVRWRDARLSDLTQSTVVAPLHKDKTDGD